METPALTDSLPAELDDRPWAAYASCRTADPDLFFPSDGVDAEPALRICRGCAVRQDCLAWAIDYRIRYGVWGGTTERDRRRLHRRSA